MPQLEGMALKAKESIFVKEFCVDRNGTRAAKEAGFGSRGSGKKAAQVAANAAARMLKKSYIQAAIAANTSKMLAKADLKAEDVLKEIQKLAFVKLSGAYDEHGNLLSVHDMPEDVQAALSGLETEYKDFGNTVVKKVKLADKVRSLEMLAKHFKLLTDLVESKVDAKVEVVDPAAVKAELAKINRDY